MVSMLEETKNLAYITAKELGDFPSELLNSFLEHFIVSLAEFSPFRKFLVSFP